jgi:hypothetical protein
MGNPGACGYHEETPQPEFFGGESQAGIILRFKEVILKFIV